MTGRQTKFCSTRCKGVYKYHHKEKGANFFSRQKERALKIKQKLVELKGGGCSKCGYNKCIYALDFHHINPETKSFPLSQRELGNHSEEKIYQEAEKCVLLCANCHREEHHQAE